MESGHNGLGKEGCVSRGSPHRLDQPAVERNGERKS